MYFDSTFSPMHIGKMAVKNRLVVPAMDSARTDDDGSVSQKTLDYYGARARGGFGLIILENAAVEKKGFCRPVELNVSDDRFIPGLQKLAKHLQQYGAKAVVQLNHAGRETNSGIIGTKPVAPSPIPCPANRQTPNELTTEEVYEVIDKFVATAVRSQKAGFDGVEIHGAHGYLVAGFLSQRSNRRTDEFGGTLTDRMNFLKLIITGIKRECGEDFPVIVRLSSDEIRIGGIKINEAIIHAKMAEEYGADAISVSMETYAATEFTVPSVDQPNGVNLPAAEAIKQVVRIPVIIAGRFMEPYIIETAIASGKTDFVALGRQSIADPEFPNKMFSGNLADIVPCLGCHTRCVCTDPVNIEISDGGITCILNPFGCMGKEYEPKPTSTPKNVMIIGAGPAGLVSA